MKNRKDKLLELIVESYVETSEPIGSKFLSEKGDLGVSGATLRNEMRSMERAGLLKQPHTSAGRIPTEDGYRYYVNNLMKNKTPGKVVSSKIQSILKQNNNNNFKDLAKYISCLCNSAVIVAFDLDSIYYTGLSSLFNQPEFHDYKRVINFSNIFDQVEDKIEKLYDLSEKSNAKVFIGRESPFGIFSSLITIKLGPTKLFVLVGTLRMNYKMNFNLISHLSSLHKKMET